MSDITDFLLARIAEDEAAARAATSGPWAVDSEIHAESIDVEGGYVEIVSGGRWGGEASVFHSTEDAIHIAQHDPARVLAECKAKRDLLEIDIDSGFHPAALEMMRVLASVYADHPDYRKEWEPGSPVQNGGSQNI